MPPICHKMPMKPHGTDRVSALYTSVKASHLRLTTQAGCLFGGENSVEALSPARQGFLEDKTFRITVTGTTPESKARYSAHVAYGDRPDCDADKKMPDVKRILMHLFHKPDNEFTAVRARFCLYGMFSHRLQGPRQVFRHDSALRLRSWLTVLPTRASTSCEISCSLFFNRPPGRCIKHTVYHFSPHHPTSALSCAFRLRRCK